MTQWLLLIVCVWVTACAESIPSQRTLLFTTDSTPQTGTLLLIQGNNPSDHEQILVIRMDDRPNPTYSQRVNIERVLPPGPFRFHLTLGGQKTPSGQPLNIDQLRQILVFSVEPHPSLTLSPLTLTAPKPLEYGAVGWDLGPEGSALWPGFQPLTPSSLMLQGQQLKGIDRGHNKQASEALTSDGIRGIERMTLPLKPGRWYVTLWLRDPGEWEYLPHPLHRILHAEGAIQYEQQYTPEQWVANVYLKGINTEAQPSDTAWHRFGARTHQRIEFAVDVDNNGLQLTLGGSQPESGFIAAILAEPKPSAMAHYSIETDRAQWWQNTWAIKDWPTTTANPPTSPQSALNDIQLATPPMPLILPPGTQTAIDYQLSHQGLSPFAEIDITPPTFNGIPLPTHMRWGQWQLIRTRLSSTLLKPVNNHLRSGPLPLLNSHPHPRRLNLHIQVPEYAPPGQYRGAIRIATGRHVIEKTIDVTVPDIQLPAADRPIGVYLDRAVHLDWFDSTHRTGDRQVTCDLHYLRELGLTGISPPLPTPDTPERAAQLQTVLSTIHRLGYHAPIMAYTPFKRLLASTNDLSTTAHVLSDLDEQLVSKHLPVPAWVTADEPSNPGHQIDVERIHRHAKRVAPGILLAGHLNHQSDTHYTNAFDLVLINDGFGANAERIHALHTTGTSAWLYNLGNHERPGSLRAASGFFLWRTHSDGYLQWHARMPTADPADPTDGRESDVQFLYPMQEVCATVPDIDASLFEIMEGIQDLRWILWLEHLAQPTTHAPPHQKQREARSLLEKLTRIIPNDWETMNTPSNTDLTATLTAWRREIQALALAPERDKP